MTPDLRAPWTLRLLGGLGLLDAQGQPGAFSTRKSGLLLARLAMAGSEGMARSRLIALLWSDRQERQARGSLRQALFALRKTFEPLGADVILGQREKVALAPGVLHVDARRVRQLSTSTEARDLAELRELYLGPLLDGVDVVDEAYEQWLVPERAQLQRSVLDALRRLMREQRASGDEGLERTARALTNLDPTCEESHRIVMTILAERGDRSGALRMFETLRGRLRDELHVEPEEETVRLALLLRRPGSAIASSDSTPSAAPVPAPPAMTVDPRQRRHVAVVHLRHEAKTSPDLESMHEQRRMHEGAAEQTAERHRGTARPSGAGALTLWFGIPTAYGDEARRAVLCALEIMGEHDGWRAGFAVGDVIVETEGTAGGPSTITGAAVERAEMLSARADHGRLLAEPAAVHEAEVHLSLTTRPVSEAVLEVRVAGPRVELTPFAGRAAEVAQLDAALTATRDEGRGRLVYVRGDAGIGKTRLARRLSERAEEQGYQTHVAHVLDFGGQSSRDALRSLVRSVSGLTDADDASQAERAADALRAELEHGDDEAFLKDLLDAPLAVEMRSLLDALEPEARREGLRRVARSVVRRASSSRPRVLVVEDLHWADGETVASLAELCEVVRETPTIFVMTSRIEGDPFDVSLRGRIFGLPITTIELGPLSPDESRAMAESLGVSQDMLQRCRDRAGGHPLFLEQLLRFDPSCAEGDLVPASVRSLVQARLDRIDADARRTFQAASVLGQRLTTDALAHVLERPSVDVDALTRQGLIRWSKGTLSFVHALLCDAIYETLLGRARRDFHRRAGEWFEGHDLLLCAEHYERAEDVRAPSAYARAAEHLRRLYRTEDALRVAKKGKELAREPREKGELTLGVAEILLDVGDMSAARRAFDDALNLVEDDDLRARAFLGRADVRRITDDLEGARRDVDAAHSAAHSADLPAELARAHFLRGNLLFPAGEVSACLKEHQTSLRIARRLGRRDLEAAALGGVGDAQYLAGRMRSAAETIESCMQLCRELGLGRIEVANHSQLAIAVVFIRPISDALGELRRARAASVRVGAKRPEINATVGQVWALYECGRYEESREVALESRGLIRRLGAFRYDQLALSFIGAVTALLDGPSAGLEILEEARAFAEASGPGFHGAEVYGHIARFSYDEGVRRRALARGEAIIRQGCVGHTPLRFYPLAARVALELGDLDLAQRMVDRLHDFTREEPLVLTDYYMDLVRTVVAARRGRLSPEERVRRADQLFVRAEALDLVVASEVGDLVDGP